MVGDAADACSGDAGASAGVSFNAVKVLDEFQAAYPTGGLD